MILDARDAQTPHRLEAEVAIVGSGAAGLALALSLDEAGVRTILVEAGGEAVDPAAQDLYRAITVEPESHGPVHLYRRRAFGGTTAIWGGRCIPFDPIDFETRDWIPHSGWPIGYADIAPFYDEALTLAQAGPALFEAERALPGTQGPMIAGVASSDVILDRIERFSNPAHFGKLYRERIAGSQTVTALTNANVTEILTGEGGAHAAGLAIRTLDGARSLTVSAPRVVIAAGGIETPRLLLASRSAKACGLGNERDLVGRYYQAHIEGEVGELHFRRPASEVLLDYQTSPEGIYCRRYIWLSPEAQRRERTGGLIARPHHPKIVDPDHRNPILSAMYLVKDLLVSEYARKMTSTEQVAKARYGGRTHALYAAHVRNIVLGAPQLAGFSWKWVRKRNLASRKLPSVVLRDPRNQYVLDLNAEQIPNPDSRIMLGEERDPLGMPRLKIQWRTVEEDRAMIARGLRAIQRAFAPSGTLDYRIDETAFAEEVAACTRVGGHHIGTARMASGPDRGVVNANGEVFGTKGLYVAGAATFPTSGFANPTLMIIASALRLGRHLASAN
jgi:choline dehydrogenase-like flavoprotein